MKDQIGYNKKRKDKSLLKFSHCELEKLVAELVDYGIEVFNKEEDKFHRWMNKPNDSLDKNTPESLLDSIVGIQEVRNCLNRIEFGNLAQRWNFDLIEKKTFYFFKLEILFF